MPAQYYSNAIARSWGIHKQPKVVSPLTRSNGASSATGLDGLAPLACAPADKPVHPYLNSQSNQHFLHPDTQR